MSGFPGVNELKDRVLNGVYQTVNDYADILESKLNQREVCPPNATADDLKDARDTIETKDSLRRVVQGARNLVAPLAPASKKTVQPSPTTTETLSQKPKENIPEKKSEAAPSYLDVISETASKSWESTQEFSDYVDTLIPKEYIKKAVGYSKSLVCSAAVFSKFLPPNIYTKSIQVGCYLLTAVNTSHDIEEFNENPTLGKFTKIVLGVATLSRPLLNGTVDIGINTAGSGDGFVGGSNHNPASTGIGLSSDAPSVEATFSGAETTVDAAATSLVALTTEDIKLLSDEPGQALMKFLELNPLAPNEYNELVPLSGLSGDEFKDAILGFATKHYESLLDYTRGTAEEQRLIQKKYYELILLIDGSPAAVEDFLKGK